MKPTVTRVPVTAGGMSQSVMRLSQEVSNLPPSRFGSGLCHGCLTRCICGRRLIEGMQGFQELHECRGLGGAQVLAIRRHVAAALEDLPDKLILRETRRDKIQSRTTLSANACNRVAVTALLRLKDDSALPLERAEIVRITDWDRGTAAPCIHFRAPGREGPKVR